jgi:hypothetical protein
VNAPSPLDLFREPHELPVTREEWLMAADLGQKRRRANDATRTATQDRGDKNLIGDVMGCLAELRVVNLCKNLGYHYEATLLHDGGGAAVRWKPDVRIQHDRWLNYDVKCHMTMNAAQRAMVNVPPKKDMALSVPSMGKALKGGTANLLPVMAAPGGDVILLGRVLPIAEVLTWPQHDYGYGSIVYRMPMAVVAPHLFGRTFAECEEIVLGGASIARLHTLLTYKAAA